MRLDLFLKVSRLIPRRSLAQEFCDAGLIDVNGIAAKSGKEIKVGDEITIKRRDRHLKIGVQHVPDTKQVSKQSAGELYEVISESRIESA
jgi:ribosomal 50S subunit-recycling heat shock protein